MSSVQASTVLPGVARFAARTPTLLPATHTNSYALGEREIVLVEPATPYEDEQRDWLAWARGLETTGRRIIAIFATHHHPDHVGGTAFFKRELGVPLWAHRETARRLTEVVDRELDEGDAFVLDGPTPMRWEPLFTPGHAPGHLCLLEKNVGAIVVGDMVASVGTILIEPTEGDMIEYLRQLARLERLDAKVALPAHGDPIHEPSRLFRAYQAHRAMREGTIERALVARGGGTLDELLPDAYADTSPAIWPIARLSLEAHLIKLEREGRAQRSGERFTPVDSTR